MDYKINFPTWEELKSLDKNKQYTCTLFEIVSSIYGRITVFEDEQMGFYFDLICNGYRVVFSNPYMYLHCFYSFNKKSYEKLQKDVNLVYNNIINTLICSGSTEHKFIEEVIF